MKKNFYRMGLSLLFMFIFVGCSIAAEDKKSVDENWPKDLPEFNYGSAVATVYDEDTGMIGGVVYAAIKNPGKVFKEYEAALFEKGWVIDTLGSHSANWSAIYELEDAIVHVLVSKNGEMAQLMYSD